MTPPSSILGDQATTVGSRTLVHARLPDHPRRCPHSPHTISRRTISSVATNTSRVSPTLCHILKAGGWARAQRRTAERRDGMSGGRPRAAHPGGGTGRCEGGPPTDRPADLPRAGATESRVERASGRHYRLIAQGSRGHGERRGWRRTDALPWRTPEGKACAGGGAADVRPWPRLARGPLGPQRRQMSTTPRGRRSCSPAPNPLPRVCSSPSTHSAATLPLRGACWEM